MLPTTLLALVVTIIAGNVLAIKPEHDSTELVVDRINPTTCSRPSRSGDKISVHYRGRLQATNVEFDESYERGEPITFHLGAGEVIKGWDQGLIDMCPGESRKLTIPPNLAYGDRDMGSIPPHSTLVFDTTLVEIVGVKQSIPSSSTAGAGDLLTIATAAATPQTESDKNTPEQQPQSSNTSPDKVVEKKECQLLGPFALFVQGALGTVAVLSLFWKRYKEVPKRPWKIFLFDVSKQVLGSFLTHILNVAMSMTGSMAIMRAARKAQDQNGAGKGGEEISIPNPCSYYLLNLAIDTTIGIFVLFLLLKVLHALFLRTPLAKPPQSITSGNYDDPPKVQWWAKQLLIYCIGLLGMKLFVYFLFQAMPWLPWVGDWALRWTKGNEALEITFAMFIFPLAMNGVQYWIIDSLIKGKSQADKGYEQVYGHDEDSDETHDQRDLNDSFLDQENGDNGTKPGTQQDQLREANISR